MSHYRASDSKKEHFRRYLEKAGVISNLTSVLVALYEQTEKPSNALEYIKENLGAAGQTAETAALQQEVTDLMQRCAKLAEENTELKTRLQHYEPISEDGATTD
ncbi:hypothetical protein LDENG_00240230 [Lucifuga dentata]|nr:hypothetical protein LDENG_00240230 [Lucifuga dentata]